MSGQIQRLIAERVPWWIRAGFGGAFLEAFGVTMDLAQQTLLTGLGQTRPLTAYPENLGLIGADRGIRQYPNEPVESYRMRLAKWRQIKRHAGSHYGEMLNLQPYFLPGQIPLLRIVHQAGDGSVAVWHTLTPAGAYSVRYKTPSNWNWDDVPEKWSRFWLIVDVSGLTPVYRNHWDDGSLYDFARLYWDGYYTSAVWDDVVSIVNDSKAAHSTLWGVILATGPRTFQPGDTATTDALGATSLPVGNWGSAINPTTGHPSRLYSAAFPYDLGQG